MTIETWSDAYCRLLEEAFASRGGPSAAERQLDKGRLHGLRDWPGTRGVDVLAIAAAVDSSLAPLPEQTDGLATRIHWQLAIVELEDALEHPTAEYRHNRSFWSALLDASAYLDAVRVPVLTDDVWDALLTVLWSPVPALRNGADEQVVRTTTESDAEKKWQQQRADAAQAHGFDMREAPPGTSGVALKIPRTTNREAIGLFDYWNQALAEVGTPIDTTGLPAQRARWEAVHKDIEALARPGKPDEVYAKNHELWRESGRLSINLAAWGEQPSRAELVFGSLGHGVAELPHTLSYVTDALGKAAGKVANVVVGAAAEAAEGAAEGLLSALKKPLLIGGGILVGTILLVRLVGSR